MSKMRVPQVLCLGVLVLWASAGQVGSTLCMQMFFASMRPAEAPASGCPEVGTQALGNSGAWRPELRPNLIEYARKRIASDAWEAASTQRPLHLAPAPGTAQQAWHGATPGRKQGHHRRGWALHMLSAGRRAPPWSPLRQPHCALQGECSAARLLQGVWQGGIQPGIPLHCCTGCCYAHLRLCCFPQLLLAAFCRICVCPWEGTPLPVSLQPLRPAARWRHAFRRTAASQPPTTSAGITAGPRPKTLAAP